MGFLSNVMKYAPTALGAGTGYIISGGNPMGAAIGGALASQAQNYMLQDRNLNYQKKLQGQIFAREDNAVRRRVQDLQAAGLSKVLGAGQSADAGAVINTHAPQLDMSNALALLQMQQNISMSKTQEDLVKAQIDTQKALGALKWHDYKIYQNWGQPSNSAGGITGTIRDLWNFSNSNVIKNADKQIMKKVIDSYKNSNNFIPNYQSESTYFKMKLKK